jgi:hypothetical protein
MALHIAAPSCASVPIASWEESAETNSLCYQEAEHGHLTGETFAALCDDLHHSCSFISLQVALISQATV